MPELPQLCLITRMSACVRETQACVRETEACVRESGASQTACLQASVSLTSACLCLCNLKQQLDISFFLGLKEKNSESPPISDGKRRRRRREGHLHAAIWSSLFSLWTRMAVMIAPTLPASAIAYALFGSTVTAI